MKLRNLGYTTAAVALAATLIACGSGDPKSSPADSAGSGAPAAAKTTGKSGPTTVAAGAAVNITTSGGDQLTVTVGAPQAKVPSGNQFITSKKGQFFVVTATVEFKTGKDTYYANTGDFKLITADGTVCEAEFVSTIEPSFESTQLNAGQKTTGKVVFDVPATVAVGSGAKIQFEGSWDGKAAAYWTL